MIIIFISLFPTYQINVFFFSLISLNLLIKLPLKKEIVS